MRTKKKIPLTAAERAKRYREKLKQDEEKLEQYKEKKHANYMRNRKLIDMQSEREKRKIRRNWRKNQKNRRIRIKKQSKAMEEQPTPPQSPTWVLEEPANLSENNSTRKVSDSAKKKRYQRKLKSYEEQLNKVKSKLKASQKENQRLKRKLAEKNEETPRKRAQKQMQESPGTLEETLIFHNALLAEIQEKTQTSDAKGKQILSKVFSGKILKKYKVLGKARKIIGLKIKKKAYSKNLEYTPKVYSRFAVKTMAKIVEAYFLQDINSRNAPGKKETITRNKVKKQRRYLNDTVKNIYMKFLEDTSVNISYAAFNKLKPFWVVRNTDQETCACKKCKNIQFKIGSLHRLQELKSKDEQKLIEQITCSQTQTCMYRLCQNCKDYRIIYSDQTEKDKLVSWYMWESKRENRKKQNMHGEEVIYNVNVAVKTKKQGTLEMLKQEFHEELENYLQHKFNIINQYRAMKTIKDNLGDGEVAVHIDFSENYCCKYEEEIQSFHFGASRHQVSLHTGVIYSKDKTQSFCSVSGNTRHDPAAIWAHLHPMLLDIGKNDKIHFMSDSPSTQYRCAKNFYMFHHMIHDKYGFSQATWNYSEAGHGKSAADGVGGLLKRTADSIVQFGNDIPNAEEFYNVLQGKTNVKLYYISDEDIMKFDRLMPKKIKGVAGSMRLHQLVSRPSHIQMRILSCFCKPNCVCYDLKTMVLQVLDSRPVTEQSPTDKGNNQNEVEGVEVVSYVNFLSDVQEDNTIHQSVQDNTTDESDVHGNKASNLSVVQEVFASSEKAEKASYAELTIGSFLNIKHGTQTIPAVVVEAEGNLFWVKYFNTSKRANMWVLGEIKYLLYEDDLFQIISDPLVVKIGRRTYYQFCDP